MVQSALAALQAGQMSLNQVRLQITLIRVENQFQLHHFSALRAADGPGQPEPGRVPVAARGRGGQAHPVPTAAAEAAAAGALPAPEPAAHPAGAPAAIATERGPPGHPAGLNMMPFLSN